MQSPNTESGRNRKWTGQISVMELNQQSKHLQQKSRAKLLHRWILSNILRKVNTYASQSVPESFQTHSVRHHTDTKIRQRNHTHTHTHKHTQRKLQAYASWSILESLQTPSVRHHTDTKIRHRNQTHTHTYTHTQNWRPNSLINIEHTKWSGLRHQLLPRACFPVVAQMGLLCLSLDVGKKEAKNSLWLLALFLHLGRSKGNWTDHKAFRAFFEALRICNPRRSRPLNLHLFCRGHPQSEGPKPHLFFASSFKSFFNHFSRKEGTANT